MSETTAAKLADKHGLDHRDVSAAIVGVANLRYVWHDDLDRGRRAVVEAFVAGRFCKIVIYPVQHPLGDVFALGSAYPQ